MPKSLGKRLDDQSIAVKKTVAENAKETLKLYAELSWKDSTLNLNPEITHWGSIHSFLSDGKMFIVASTLSSVSGSLRGTYLYMSLDGEEFVELRHLSSIEMYNSKVCSNGNTIVFLIQNNTSGSLSGNIYVSHDLGATWANRMSVSGSAEDIRYGNGIFAIGHRNGSYYDTQEDDHRGSLLISRDDGNTWSETVPAGASAVLTDFEYLNGYFVICNCGYRNVAVRPLSISYYVTKDFITYTKYYFPQRPDAASGPWVDEFKAAYGNGKYVFMLGGQSEERYFASSDTLEHSSYSGWTMSTTPVKVVTPGSSSKYYSLKFLDDRFLAVYNDASEGGSSKIIKSMYSIDAVTWAYINPSIKEYSSLVAMNIELGIQGHRAWVTSGNYIDDQYKLCKRTVLDITQNSIRQTDAIAESIEPKMIHKQDKLTAGSNINIASDGTITATDTTYTAGEGINIQGNVISSAGGSGNAGGITYIPTLSFINHSQVATPISSDLTPYVLIGSKTFSDGTIHVYCHENVFESEDNGETWETKYIRSGSHGYSKGCEFNGDFYILESVGETSSIASKTIYVSHETSVDTYASTAIFTPSSSSVTTKYPICITSLNNKLFAMISGLLYVSDDGTTWTSYDISSIANPSSIIKIGNYYCITTTSTHDYISTDLTTWTQIGGGTLTSPVHIIEQLFDGAILYSGTGDDKYKFTTDLTTFSQCTGFDSGISIAKPGMINSSKAVALETPIPSSSDKYAYVSSDGIRWVKKGKWSNAFSGYTDPGITEFGDCGSVFNYKNGTYALELSFSYTGISDKIASILYTSDGETWKLTTTPMTEPVFTETFNCYGHTKAGDNDFMLYYRSEAAASGRSMNICKISDSENPGEIKSQGNDITEAMSSTVTASLPKADGTTISDATGSLVATGYNSLKLVEEQSTSVNTNNVPISNGSGTWTVSAMMFSVVE